MPGPSHDRIILRDLAQQLAEIASLPEQAEKIRLWTACNDLHPERPMVFTDPQNGWRELDDAFMRLECRDPTLRSVEHGLRRRLIRHRHIHDDFPILASFPIDLRVIGSTYEEYGLALSVTRSAQADGAYQIEPAVRGPADLERLHFRPIRLDHQATDQAVEQADVLGDILPAYKAGRISWRYGLTRVLVHLRDDFLREIDLFEKEQAVSPNQYPDHVTGSGGLSPTRDLPGEPLTGSPGFRHCLCWGESQETGGVGPGQFDEFVLQYQVPLLSRFGLADYGCCEPLDAKYDLLIRRIPHLRWLAVRRWAERIGRRMYTCTSPTPHPSAPPRRTGTRRNGTSARPCGSPGAAPFT